MFACIHWPQADDLLELATTFSPFVERVTSDTVLFSLDGLQRIYGDAQATVHAITCRAPDAQVAVAATPDAAVLAARHLQGIGVIPAGEEVRFLGSLPLDCLPIDPDTLHVLHRWGLHTLADLAGLPETGLHERLGEAGVRWQRKARGALGRPLDFVMPETVYEETIELDHPIDLIEPLLFLLARFLNDLCGQLKAQSLAAGELRFTLNGTERVLRLPFPTRDTKFLLKLLQHNLEAKSPGEPLTKLALRIIPVEPRLIQHDLFTLAAPEPERLELTLGKIRGIVGENGVKVPTIRNTYRPGWGRAESHLAFRHFRPPLEARVEIECGKLCRLHAAGIHGTIKQLSGPWRTSGEWWRDDAWDRDEFDLELSDGVLYRLCFDRSKKRWLVEGVYD